MSYFSDESMGVHEKAISNPEFGKLYVYMCIYFEKASENMKKLAQFDTDYYKLSLMELCIIDFEENFTNTHSTKILREYLNK